MPHTIAAIVLLSLSACASAGVAIIKAGSVAVAGIEAANAINLAGEQPTNPIAEALACAKLPEASGEGRA